MNGFFRFVHRFFGPIFRFFHPVNMIGLEELPRSGVLLCPNHSSNWDPVLLAVSLPIDYHLHIMAKAQLFRIPVVAWVFSKLGAFAVDRGGADLNAIKTAMNSIKAGDNLLIFPEGTRVEQEGDAPAKGGAAMIGVRTGAILVPVSVGGKKRLFQPTNIVFGKPYTPVYTGRHGTAEELQKIADDLLHEAYELGRAHPCR
ncbi:MAG: lysophospholipid acyltransferase family protein [Oscillospiraceae bacterium]